MRHRCSNILTVLLLLFPLFSIFAQVYTPRAVSLVYSDDPGNTIEYTIGTPLPRPGGPDISLSFSFLVPSHIPISRSSILVGNADWPYTVSINNTTLGSRGSTTPYNGIIYHPSLFHISRYAVGIGDNVVTITGFPLFEITHMPHISIGDTSSISRSFFLRSFLNVYFLQGAIVISLISSIFFGVYYIFVSHNLSHLFTSLFCLFFSVGWCNQPLWYDSINATLLYTVSRIGIICAASSLFSFSLSIISYKFKPLLFYILLFVVILYSLVFVGLTIYNSSDKYSSVSFFVDTTSKLFVTPFLIFILACFSVNYIMNRSLYNILLLGSIFLIIASGFVDVSYISSNSLPYFWLVSYPYFLLIIILFYSVSQDIKSYIASTSLIPKLNDLIASSQNITHTIINNCGLGIFTFDNTLHISGIVSNSCLGIFKRHIENEYCPDILFSSNYDKSLFIDSMGVVFQNKSFPVGLSDVQISTLTVNNKYYDVSYHYMNSGLILCILYDITYLVNSKEEYSKYTSLYSTISFASTYHKHINPLISSIKKYNGISCINKNDFYDVLRLSVDSSLFGMNQCSESLYKMLQNDDLHALLDPGYLVNDRYTIYDILSIDLDNFRSHIGDSLLAFSNYPVVPNELSSEYVAASITFLSDLINNQLYNFYYSYYKQFFYSIPNFVNFIPIAVSVNSMIVINKALSLLFNGISDYLLSNKIANASILPMIVTSKLRSQVRLVIQINKSIMNMHEYIVYITNESIFDNVFINYYNEAIGVLRNTNYTLELEVVPNVSTEIILCIRT